LDPVVEDGRVRRFARLVVPLVVAVERHEPVDNGLVVLLDRIRSRIGREPRLRGIEEQRRREPGRKLVERLRIEGICGGVVRLRAGTARERGAPGSRERAEDGPTGDAGFGPIVVDVGPIVVDVGPIVVDVGPIVVDVGPIVAGEARSVTGAPSRRPYVGRPSETAAPDAFH